jgi:catechol 2,3-dioxygenase-like lactoylglutathione lyase family enzyme
MKIYITSVFVEDQDKALAFYTRMLGFELKYDIPLGKHRWLTVVEKGKPDSTQLLLEPGEHPAVKPYKEALVGDGIPATSFQVDNLDAEYARLSDLGVEFTLAPMDAGTVKMAVLNDTCGNLIQLVEMKEAAINEVVERTAK